MKKVYVALTGLLGLVLAFQVSAAHATAILTLYDVGTNSTVSIQDNSAGDSDPTAGIISVNDTIGVWQLNFVVGATKPFLGTATDPKMGLFSVDGSVPQFRSLTGGGELDITFTDTGFGPFSGSLESVANGSSTLGGSVALSSIADTTHLGDFSFGSGNFSGTANQYISSLSSLEIAAKIVHQFAGITLLDFHVNPDPAPTSVPEPGTFMLLGTGLVGIAFYRRRRK